MPVAVVDDFEFECSCVSDPTEGQEHSTGCLVANHARAAQYALDHDQVVPLMAMVPDHRPAPWKIVAAQLPKSGAFGITYHQFNPGPEYGGKMVDALVHRNRKGRVTGVLYYYRVEFGTPGSFPYQAAGSINMWVDPARQGRGVGRALTLAAIERWPDIDLGVQSYTRGGLAMARIAQEARRASTSTSD